MQLCWDFLRSNCFLSFATIFIWIQLCNIQNQNYPEVSFLLLLNVVLIFFECWLHQLRGRGCAHADMTAAYHFNQLLAKWFLRCMKPILSQCNVQIFWLWLQCLLRMFVLCLTISWAAPFSWHLWGNFCFFFGIEKITNSYSIFIVKHYLFFFRFVMEK